MTELQRRVLRELSVGPYPPTIREVAGRLGCSFRGVHHSIEALVKRGLVRKDGATSRGVKVLDGVSDVIQPKRCACGATFFGTHCPRPDPTQPMCA